MNRKIINDEWSLLAKFLGEMIAKYADVIDIDSLPDPHKYLTLKNIREKYIRLLKTSTKYRTKKHLHKWAEYDIFNPK